MIATVSQVDLKVVTPVPVKKYEGQCPFAEFGCDYAGGLDHLQQHIQDESTKHLSLLCDSFQELTTSCRTAQIDDENDERRLGFVGFRFRELGIIFSSQLVWRIDDVRSLIREARDDIRPSIFSPAFYTGKHGYKLAASVALNGDGEARGEYISVFITILQGEYDSLLPWPFSHTVTFTLLDQRQAVAGRRSISKSLKPNTCKENKYFLGRPLGERNPRFGLRKFIKIKEIFDGDYVKDEAIFLKIDIDQEDMTNI